MQDYYGKIFIYIKIHKSIPILAAVSCEISFSFCFAKFWIKLFLFWDFFLLNTFSDLFIFRIFLFVFPCYTWFFPVLYYYILSLKKFVRIESIRYFIYLTISFIIGKDGDFSGYWSMSLKILFYSLPLWYIFFGHNKIIN